MLHCVSRRRYTAASILIQQVVISHVVHGDNSQEADNDADEAHGEPSPGDTIQGNPDLGNYTVNADHDPVAVGIDGDVQWDGSEVISEMLRASQRAESMSFSQFLLAASCE